MVKQFLETLWPVFGFARIIGMFPCKRKWNEDGTMEMKPMNWKVQWLLFGLIYFLITIPAMSLIVWNYLKSGRTMEEILQCQKDLAGGESVLDLLTFILIMVLMSLVVNVTQYKNFKMRQGLNELSLQLSKSSQDDSPLVPFLIVSGLMFPLSVTFTWWQGYFIRQCFDLSWMDVVPVMILNALLFIVNNIPVFVFFGLTLECFSSLICKMTQLNQQIVEQHKLNKIIFDQVLNVVKTLENVRVLLSNNLFVVMTVISVDILVMLYLVPANFINYSKTKEPIGLLSAGYMLLYAICYSMFLWFFNIRAQRVTNILDKLKEDFLDIYVPNESFMVMYEGQAVPASFMKDRILDKINSFDGFDGKRYFVLGKSFLKNFLAFCTTYFVILLQFKLSESNQ